jgi:hypothetical protein
MYFLILDVFLVPKNMSNMYKIQFGKTYLRHTLPFPQLTASAVLALGLSVPMFSLIHSTYQCIFCNDPEFLNTPFP